MMTMKKQDSNVLETTVTSRSAHWTSREHRWNPTFCGGDQVLTWLETWLLGYYTWLQAPIPTKGSPMGHPPASNSAIHLCLVPWPGSD